MHGPENFFEANLVDFDGSVIVRYPFTKNTQNQWQVRRSPLNHARSVADQRR